jgi:hypothetical protein
MICVPRRAVALMRFGHPRLRIQQFASGAIWKLFSSKKTLEVFSPCSLALSMGGEVFFEPEKANERF